MEDKLAQQILTELQGIKQDVGELKQDVGALKQDVGALKQDVGELKQGQLKLEQDVGELKQGQQKLEQDVSELKQGQQKLEQDVSELKQGQQKLEQDVGELKQEFKEQLMLQGHKLSLEIRALKREHGQKLDELLDICDENNMLFDKHEPRITKLEDTVDTLAMDMNILKITNKSQTAN